MRKFSKDPAIVSGLSPEQYRVTQQNGTERPGTGEYLDNHERGIYVDIVSGEPLFASSDKFDSGCGWPSFTKPIEPANVNELRDTTLGMVRTELRSAHGDSHLGHVFPDGREDNARLVDRMRETHNVCEEHRDVATTSLLEVWIGEAERRAWFLFEATRPGETPGR